MYPLPCHKGANCCVLAPRRSRTKSVASWGDVAASSLVSGLGCLTVCAKAASASNASGRSRMARFMTRILVEYLGSPQSRGLAKRWECDGGVLRKDSLPGRLPCTSTGLVSGSLLYCPIRTEPAFQLNVRLPVNRPESDFSSVGNCMVSKSSIDQGRFQFLIAFSRALTRNRPPYSSAFQKRPCPARPGSSARPHASRHRRMKPGR
jgi:hypothetical protein